MRQARPLVVPVMLLALAGCASQTHSAITTPGAEASTSAVLRDETASVLQDKDPVDELNLYVCGYHFYGDEPSRQLEVHAFHSMLNAEVSQAVLYDANTDDAKLIGIEYVISERLFRELPEEEKKLWHSHAYSVKTGLMAAPGLTDGQEHRVMEKLVGTYGKCFQTWQVDKGDVLPYGTPRLMMTFTGDGQLDPALARERDRRFGVEESIGALRAQREDIAVPDLADGADAWQDGRAPRLGLLDEEGRPVRGTTSLPASAPRGDEGLGAPQNDVAPTPRTDVAPAPRTDEAPPVRRDSAGRDMRFLPRPGVDPSRDPRFVPPLEEQDLDDGIAPVDSPSWSLPPR